MIFKADPAVKVVMKATVIDSVFTNLNIRRWEAMAPPHRIISRLTRTWNRFLEMPSDKVSCSCCTKSERILFYFDGCSNNFCASHESFCPLCHDAQRKNGIERRRDFELIALSNCVQAVTGSFGELASAFQAQWSPGWRCVFSVSKTREKPRWEMFSK